MKYLSFLPFLLTLSFLISPTFAFAQLPKTATEFQKQAEIQATKGEPVTLPGSLDHPSILTAPEQSGTVNCFDYYHFGSIEANLIASITHTVPGVPVEIKGSLSNHNPYPLIDGSLYVRIFKLEPDSANAHKDGYLVVDQFIAKEGIIIPAYGTTTLQFTWTVPGHLASGEYRIATFFTTAKRYNLLGLSFTDDITGPGP